MKEYYSDTKCFYNFNVMCKYTEDCQTCGWNPKVAKAREEKIKAKLKRK